MSKIYLNFGTERGDRRKDFDKRHEDGKAKNNKD